jgi:hypothetical protein
MEIIKILIMQSSPLHCYLVPLRPKHSKICLTRNLGTTETRL